MQITYNIIPPIQGAQLNQYMRLNITNAHGNRNLQTRSTDFAVCSVSLEKKGGQVFSGGLQSSGCIRSFPIRSPNCRIGGPFVMATDTLFIVGGCLTTCNRKIKYLRSGQRFSASEKLFFFLFFIYFEYLIFYNLFRSQF